VGWFLVVFGLVFVVYQISKKWQASLIAKGDYQTARLAPLLVSAGVVIGLMFLLVFGLK
jgi:hypothetical protein